MSGNPQYKNIVNNQNNDNSTSDDSDENNNTDDNNNDDDDDDYNDDDNDKNNRCSSKITYKRVMKLSLFKPISLEIQTLRPTQCYVYPCNCYNYNAQIALWWDNVLDIPSCLSYILTDDNWNFILYIIVHRVSIMGFHMHLGHERHCKNLIFRQLIPQFWKSVFPLTCRSITRGLGERPIDTPAPRQIRTSCVWAIFNRTVPCPAIGERFL